MVYGSDVDERPMMNVVFAKHKNGDIIFTVYTQEYVYKFKHGQVAVSMEPNPLGMLPIIEYPAADYLGIYEPVIPLVDALNALQSNRLDDVAQYINSFLAIPAKPCAARLCGFFPCYENAIFYPLFWPQTPCLNLK